MLSNQQAIARLVGRDRYLETKILEMQAERRSVHWLLQDREAIALAIAALEFVILSLAYDEAQSSTL